MRLDRFFRVFVNTKYTHIDPSSQQDDLTSLVEPDGDEPFVLHPGEFVLGSTLSSSRCQTIWPGGSKESPASAVSAC